MTRRADTHEMPPADDTPMTLNEAAETLLRGLVTGATLRAAAQRKELTVERIGRIVVTTPKAVAEWRSRCRVKAEARSRCVPPFEHRSDTGADLPAVRRDGEGVMRVLDLFSGIGGFSLGLERAGMRTVAFCEIDPFCRRVLAKHWPEVPIYDDIRDLTAERLAADGIAVDVVCGGFPCQDISVAGKGAGIDGARSGLWSEYARLVGELRPGHVIVENVAALLGRGLDRVLGDLAALGYDAEWHCIPASAVGAPHSRDRLWLVAYPDRGGDLDRIAAVSGVRHSEDFEWWRGRLDELGASDGVQRCRSYADVRRAVHGISDWSHRLRALGNAVVPQIPEMIGRAIMRAAA